MLNRSIGILLSATIVACPFFCNLGNGGAVSARDESGAGACDCCRTSGKPAPADEQSCPARDSSPASGDCRCICGGAVVEDVALPDIGVDTSCTLPAPIVDSLPAPVQEARFRACGANPWPDDGTNPGRALCCLYNTYQC